MAPARRAQAEGHPGAPDGLPRDHQAGDPRGRRQPAPDQRRPGRGPGGPPHPGPPLRLRGLARAVEEGHVRPLRRAGPVRGDPAGRRPRARADQVPGGVLLGPRGHLRRRRRTRAADVPRPAALHRRGAGGQRRRLRLRRRALRQEGARPPRPQPGRGPRRGPARHVVRRPVGRGEALQAVALCAVSHHHPPAGGEPQARHERLGDHVGRPAALRERLHHLHAHRLDHPVERGGTGRPVAGARALRPGVPARQPSRLRVQGQERPGGARGDPSVGRLVPHARPDRPDRRAVPALRADLDAHGRLADEGRRRPVGLGAPRRRRVRRARRGLRGVRPGDHLPRVPQGLRRGHRRRQAQRRRPGAPARADRG